MAPFLHPEPQGTESAERETLDSNSKVVQQFLPVVLDRLCHLSTNKFADEILVWKHHCLLGRLTMVCERFTGRCWSKESFS